MVRIIALDPGGTTGWATATEDGGTTSYNCGQIGPNVHHSQLYTFLELQHSSKSDCVVYESFEFRQGAQRANLNLMSREYIGVIRLFEQERRVATFHQTAAQAKGLVSDTKIKKLDLWYPGWQHAMDAFRHLLYFIVVDTPAAFVDTRLEILQAWR
jgi:hypothetical protein